MFGVVVKIVLGVVWGVGLGAWGGEAGV